LSGRQGAWGGDAERSWRPVHSKGLFEGFSKSLLKKLKVMH
jgi:hypothetical protein